jgi:hypothetical protein
LKRRAGECDEQKALVLARQKAANEKAPPVDAKESGLGKTLKKRATDGTKLFVNQLASGA